MIEDLGGEVSPRRRDLMRLVSIALVGAALVGWAVASSPLFQGPFAEPKPTSSPAARYTPAATQRIEPAAFFSTARGCVATGATTGTTAFVSGRSVVYERPIIVGPWSCVAPSDPQLRPPVHFLR